MKKYRKFLSLLLALVMTMSLCVLVLAAFDNSDSVVTPDTNRYYYVYEYTDYKGPKCFTVSVADAQSEDTFRAAIAIGVGTLALYYTGGETTTADLAAGICDQLLPYSPTYRAGYYEVYARERIKYKVDSLDTSSRVPVDRWYCTQYNLYDSSAKTTLRASDEVTLHAK